LDPDPAGLVPDPGVVSIEPPQPMTVEQKAIFAAARSAAL
jgi:hypothetical protein